jgi:trehalose-phosphatase
MRHLFDNWRQISARLRAAGTVALFLDFDGTLARLRMRPDEVLLNDSTRRALARLARNPRVHVWLISGRRLADVRRRTRVPGVRYLGLHGWEGRAATPLNPETQRLLERAMRKLARHIEQMPGIRIEDKGPAFTVHHRGAPELQVGRARASVDEVMASLDSSLRVLEGHNIWEILPAAIGDKGTAVQHELNLFGRPGLPVYVGDDISDEAAFAALPYGVTIRVGRPSVTRAKFQLRNTNEVRRFLEKLEAEFS